jgi:hypothetical protein
VLIPVGAGLIGGNFIPDAIAGEAEPAGNLDKRSLRINFPAISLSDVLNRTVR